MPDALPLRLTASLPGTGGRIRLVPDDFQVEEIPAYLPSGEGEHLLLWVEKVELDTPEAARLLAAALGLSANEVSWAGLKDRAGRTRQWLSVPARAEAALGEVRLEPRLRILSHGRHRNRLRVGHLRGNRFLVRIREPQAPEAAQPVLDVLTARGLPNVFGEQRFGRGDTAVRGRALLAGERLPRRPTAFERKLYISAYQSLLFNRALGQRLAAGLFGRARMGDVLRKSDTGGLFLCQEPEVDQPRVDRLEVSPTGPIFGWRMTRAEGEVDADELALLAADGLAPESFRTLGGLAEGTRRAYAVPVTELGCERDGPDLLLRFVLPKGSYATVLLDEVMKAEAGLRPRVS
jgi:tRNA pseudouridine13 synthase